MERFNFEERSERAALVNLTCKLIVQKCNGNLKQAIVEIETFYDLAVSNIRNLGELIDSEISLFFLFELCKHGADNYDFTQSEYLEAIEKTKKACKEFYLNND